MAYVNIDERYLIRIEIEPDQVEVIDREYAKKDKLTKKPTGETGMLYSQKAYIFLGRQIIECKLSMEKGQPPYPAGNYLLHPATLKVDGFGGLDLGFNTILIPLSEAKAK
ncbi:single-stranded DNA-binding protein [Salmonella enterica]